MKISNRGLMEIASYEGLCLKPYYDSVGVITIGFGSTVSEIPDIGRWDKNASITVDMAILLFKKSMAKYEKAVNDSIRVNISQAQYDALVSFCYNVGTSGLKRSTLVKRINMGLKGNAIYQAFLMWDIPKEIIGRRTKEANLFVNGKYTNNGYCTRFETDGKGHMMRVPKYRFDLKPYFNNLPSDPVEDPSPSRIPAPDKPLPEQQQLPDPLSKTSWLQKLVEWIVSFLRRK